jgi:hypothetical protein
MANRIEFAVSVTPIATVAAGENVAVDTIAADIGKTLGGSASVTTGHTTAGYGTTTTGVVVYANAVASGKTQLGNDDTLYKLVFIKNTGFQFSSYTALGDATTNTLDVYIEITGGSLWMRMCAIPAGGAIILPNWPAQGAGKGLHVETSGSDSIAVEYFLSV